MGQFLGPSSVLRKAITAGAALGVAMTIGSGVTYTINKLNPSNNANNGYITTFSASGSQVAGLHSNGNLALSGALVGSGGITLKSNVNIPRIVEIPLCIDGTACAVGSGASLGIPPDFNNYRVTSVYACAHDAGTTGTMSMNIKNPVDNVVILSTALTLDSGEKCSNLADVQPVINVANRVVTSYDILTPYITAVHTTPAQGVTIFYVLSPP